MGLKQTLTTLLPLTADPNSAHEVYQLLAAVPFYTEQASVHSLKDCTDVEDSENLQVLTKSRVLCREDSNKFGCRPLVMPKGTVGEVMGDVIRWEHTFSAWEWFILMCANLLSTAGAADGEWVVV